MDAVENEVVKYLTSRRFEFGVEKGNVVFSRNLTFKNNGTIGGYSDPNERKWRIDGDQLLLCDSSNNPTSAYPISKLYKPGFYGESIKNKGVKFFIRPRKKWDIVQIKILVSVLKQQGIRHVVACSGTRAVSILRLIENNKDFFIIHPVVDERSAAYYAHGLAAKLQQPVALICTSGTAASNFLPGITESYYAHTPLIVITGDRHPMYVNNFDEQTVPQVGMYADVVKKSVTLSSGEHPRFAWFAEKQIKSAILEAEHGTPGPVHINVPILTIERRAPEDEDYKLYDLKPIQRLTHDTPEAEWSKRADMLSAAKKVMILYGQSQPITPDEQASVEEFAKKYGAVIVAGNISNIHGDHVVHPYRLLDALSHEEFNAKLAPDILISVGGSQVGTQLITEHLRNTGNSMQHWLVEPSGFYADKFYHLTAILECTNQFFFRFFDKKADETPADESYIQTWRSMLNAHPQLVDGADSYSQFNITGKFLNRLPSGSMLHLGNSNSYWMSQQYEIDPSIEVQCNRGVNGIDGSASSFMGQVAIAPKTQLCFLIIGDLSFFYDMNSLVNKPLGSNVRVMMINNGKAGLLAHHNVEAITQRSKAVAEGWVTSLGFTYLSSYSMQEYTAALEQFLSPDSHGPIFFEVFI